MTEKQQSYLTKSNYGDIPYSRFVLILDDG